MSLVHLGHIRLGDRILHQYIDTDSDATHFVEGLTAKSVDSLFTVDSDGYLFHKKDQIGKFGYFGIDNWGYTHHNGEKLVNLGKELIDAERIVVHHILSHGEYDES